MLEPNTRFTVTRVVCDGIVKRITLDVAPRVDLLLNEKVREFANPQPFPAYWKEDYDASYKPCYRNIITNHVIYVRLPSESLPDGWMYEYSEPHKCFYYYEVNTGKKSWTPPPYMSSPSLPPGWIELRDRNGRTYYQNNFTKVTQWERPQYT